MARKTKAPPAPTDTQPDPEHDQWLNEYRHKRALQSSFNAAVVTEAYLAPLYGKDALNLTDLSHHLSERAQALQGDTPLRQVEEMLLAQANALNAMFTSLAERATKQVYMKNVHRHTPHGFRHVASTMLREQGYPRDHVEAALAHITPGVEGVYNKAGYLEQRLS